MAQGGQLVELGKEALKSLEEMNSVLECAVEEHVEAMTDHERSTRCAAEM